MHKTTFTVLALTAGCFLSSEICPAAPLTEAHVTKIINQVKLVDPASGDRNAKLDDIVSGDLALTTGIKSRSELTFQDNTLTRLGPESYFSFKSGTREMTLQKGTMLLQVPKGLGGAKIHTAAVTAAITGTTIMMEYVPNKDIKVLVLEGSLRLSMNGRFGDSLLLTPGKMVIMPPNARRIPDPVTVDLKKVVQTSKLVNMQAKKGKQASSGSDSLPSMGKIEKSVEQQQTGKDAHRLADTNLVILGKGTNVVIAPDELLADLTARTNVEKNSKAGPPPAPLPVATPGPTPIPAPTPNSNPPPTGAPPPPPPGVYVTDNTTTVATQPSSATITTQGVTYSGVIYTDLPTNGSPSGFLFAGPSAFDNELDFDNFYNHQFSHSAVFVFDSLQLGGINFNLAGENNNVALVGNNGITNGPAAINLAGVRNILFATKSGNITLDSTISFSTAVGDKPNLVEFYARSGDVNIGSNFTLANSILQFAAENNAILSGGTISAKDLEVTGLLTIQFDDNANVSDLFQLNGGDVELGGIVTGHHGFIYGSSATINGSFSGESLTANVTGNFTLNGGVSLNTGNRQFQVTAGGTATINGTVTGNLTIIANDMAFATDFAVGPSFKGELTATGGNIDATGHALSGFDQILLNSGNFTVGTLTSTKTVSVGGTLAGNSITADTITANALQVDSLTANKTLTVHTSNLAPYSTGTISINAPTLNLLAGANLNGVNGTPLIAPTNASNLTISTGNYTLATNFNLNGGDGDPLASDAGGNGGQLDLTSNGSLTVNAPITATTGLNSTNAMTGGNGGTVNLTASNTITLNNKIEVSSNDGNRHQSATGGHINIKSTATGGTAINVSSSAQLLALLNAAAPGPGGSIKFTSAGGAISMSGTVQADRGTIEVTNNGTNAGQINLTNATLMADTVKVGALSPNGTLNVGGGSISADTMLKLYAGGSNGTIDFTDNVTLGGNSAKIIAANAVIINNGKIVTILGPTAADVFTNHANYTGFGGNGTTTGTFAGKGAATHPLSAAPGY
ncbi:MAG TPA: FecR domain-containing protein [Chthoniobacterales bacterium]|nr:FecR domain-containing protein [Chthoniobacterales bacterium]